METKVIRIRKLSQEIYAVSYHDQEYNFKILGESTMDKLWDELEKIDKLAEVIL